MGGMWLAERYKKYSDNTIVINIVIMKSNIA